MKKLLLTIASVLAIGSFVPASANNESFIYFDEDENFMFGYLRRVSPNGVWVVGCDEDEETGSMIINTADPENFIFNEDGLMLDVDNNGLIAGAYFNRIGQAKYKKAAIFRNGAWECLPLPTEIIGQSYAVAISADSKTIAGHGMCQNEDPEEPGKYFPMIWKLNEETNQYELAKLYNNLYLPGTMGFFIEDMTPDGRYLCGSQWLDMGDALAAMLDLETGEYKIWHQIEYKTYVWEYKGTQYESTGMYVDGLLDGFDETTRFQGRLSYATDRYLFGSHSTAYNVQEDGSGEISTAAAVYDLVEGRFIDGDTDYSYTCGLNPEDAFTTTGELLYNGQRSFLTEYVGTGDKVNFIYSFDDAQRVLTGSFIAMTPWGEYFESPVLVLLQEPIFAGIADVSVDRDAAKVSVDGRVINVSSARQIQVFNAGGTLISTDVRTAVAPGVYIVVTDGVSHKVAVK